LVLAVIVAVVIRVVLAGFRAFVVLVAVLRPVIVRVGVVRVGVRGLFGRVVEVIPVLVVVAVLEAVVVIVSCRGSRPSFCSTRFDRPS
jgi:hypothetical protein